MLTVGPTGHTLGKDNLCSPSIIYQSSTSKIPPLLHSPSIIYQSNTNKIPPFLDLKERLIDRLTSKKKMASFTNSKYQFLCAVLVLLHTGVLCFQYKVGDLDAWGIPTSGNRLVYTNWAQKHHFQIGDSLLFLYPPSQDSVIQVTEQAFNTCNISDPILYLHDGNSVFNLTSPQKYYFTSGVPGNCEKSQKLEISLISGDGSSFSPSYAPSMLPATSPSYANAFGSIPTSSSPALQGLLGSVIVVVGSAIMFIL